MDYGTNLADILQMTFSNAIFLEKNSWIWLDFHCNLFLKKTRHIWFRRWLRSESVTNYYLDRWRPTSQMHTCKVLKGLAYSMLNGFNPFWPSNSLMAHRTRSSLVLIVAYSVLSHHLDQWQHHQFISKTHWNNKWTINSGKINIFSLKKVNKVIKLCWPWQESIAGNFWLRFPVWNRMKYSSCGEGWQASQIARFTWPTWGPPGSCWPQVGPSNLAIRAVNDHVMGTTRTSTGTRSGTIFILFTWYIWSARKGLMVLIFRQL